MAGKLAAATCAGVIYEHVGESGGRDARSKYVARLALMRTTFPGVRGRSALLQHV